MYHQHQCLPKPYAFAFALQLHCMHGENNRFRKRKEAKDIVVLIAMDGFSNGERCKAKRARRSHLISSIQYQGSKPPSLRHLRIPSLQSARTSYQIYIEFEFKISGKLRCLIRVTCSLTISTFNADYTAECNVDMRSPIFFFSIFKFIPFALKFE